MRFSFGEHVLDTGTRELLRDGEPVSLSPKAFQLLHLLVERRPNAISKSDLQDQLWPDTHVLEANLANLVADLRAALGDDPRRPRYIRTVHRFGYAFRDAEEVAPAAAPKRARWRLVWRGGEAAVGPGDHVLGRDDDLDVTLDFPTVSRRHARLTITRDGATLADLDSKNGTFVNGRRLNGSADLADGDEIRLGSLRLRLRRAPTSTETVTSTE
jgi:DNA-binding winged helix-turn-helix (wHTH) protein